jgi:arylsulfatase A-like enzyme
MARTVIVLTSASVVVGFLTGSTEALSRIEEQGYLEQGLYRLAGILLLRHGWRPWLHGAAITLAVLGVAVFLLSRVRRLRGPGERSVSFLPGRPAAFSGPVGRLSRIASVGVVAMAMALLAAGATVLVYVCLPILGPHGSSVVVIVIDTLRADHLGAYGGDAGTTPNLDAFAREGFLFRNAYSASSWTRPSIASILTATLPTDHRITTERKGDVLPPRFTTMQEYFGNRGYRTGAFVTNPHYRRGMDGDFQRFELHGNMGAGELYPRVSAFIDEIGTDPFFLLVHNNDPHDSYDYREGFSKHPPESPYRRLDGLFPSHEDGPQISSDSPEHRSGIRRLDEEAIEEMQDNYDGEIAYLDHFIGGFLDELRRKGLLETTIVAIVADHGEEFLDHGGYWHGATLYDELLRVPFLLRVPGLPGREIETRVSTVDLFPTILDLLNDGERLRGHQRGRSLVALLRGGSRSGKAILGVTAFRGDLKYSLIVGNMKLIRFAEGEVIGLFDLAADPGERNDLSARLPERVKEIDLLLQDIIRGSPEKGLPPESGKASKDARAIDEETERLMRELGYVER